MVREYAEDVVKKDSNERGVSCGKQKFRVPVSERSDTLCSKFKYKCIVIHLPGTFGRYTL